ncbi:hypothetical protein J2S40_001362 [Nocardioides luteus]|uniref:Uncharacterized protein n=1 Tax=Nocardioides luteus TaxID=1844 RepID=A0ABQ5T2H1_9ACTN|nr:hypothetical protein [Nocardioides luteus]MDR7310304.1 hypothetical protein [Nocardioides luteus]GGR53594.1 hypothetical protein GCM10010197_20010 [Nocardioides luteus]GLJ69917.1 hypothetical protein GCM10017579_39530 [Nocardioides luteus]
MGIANSLRAELFGATTKTPPFAMLLPEGWVTKPADMEALGSQVQAALAQVPGADTARLRASVDSVLSQAGVGAESNERLIAWITQQDVPVDDFVPMSFALAWLEAPAGTSMMSLAKQLVNGRNAAPLDEAGTILRWVDRADLPVEGGVVHTVQPTYLIRVPHAPETALIIRATILDGAEGEHLDEEGVSAMTLLSDGIVATFRWKRDA